ncbi:hypothetical protein OAM79_01355 [Litorivicinus sp.]|nr:hypothetical protein [Litorivicinus sp.]
MSLFRRLLGDTKEILGGGAAHVSSRNIAHWRAFNGAIRHLQTKRQVAIWAYDSYSQKRISNSDLSTLRFAHVNFEKDFDNPSLLNVIFRTKYAYDNYVIKADLEMCATPMELFYYECRWGSSPELAEEREVCRQIHQKTDGLVERLITFHANLENGPKLAVIGDFLDDPFLVYDWIKLHTDRLLHPEDEALEAEIEKYL